MLRQSPQVFLYLALACEAKPIADRLRLKKNPHIHTFSVYSNESVFLTVTGVGKTAMAAGIGFTQALFCTSPFPVMINIGIAGHRFHSLGSFFTIDKITDSDTGRRFYPPLVYTPPCSTESLLTVAKPQPHYPEENLCDMEGSAYFETSTRFSTSELVQCLKIVSDNASSPAESIQPQQVSELIHGHLSAIEQTIRELQACRMCLADAEHPEFDTLIKKYRFSASELIQLKKLLQRWRLIHGDQALDNFYAPTGKDFLRALALRLDQIAFYL